MEAVAASLFLPTFVFGPRNPEGRDFQLLAQSGSIDHLSVEARGLIYDVPLLLSGWGSSGESDVLFAAALGPDSAPWLVVRAALLGRSGIGVRTFGHGVLIEPIDGNPAPAIERLAALLPRPDGGQGFAGAPIAVDAARLVVGDRQAEADRAWGGLDLGWQDRIVIAPPQNDGGAARETALISALASIDPPAQRARVRGWSTSAAMQPVGRFDPRRLFQLAFADTAEMAAAYPHHLPYRPGAADNAAVEPPGAYRIWRQLRAVMAGHANPAVAGLDLAWQPEDSGLDDATARFELLNRVGQSLDGMAIMELIDTLLEPVEGIANGDSWRAAAAATFMTRVRDTRDARAAPWFLARASEFGEAKRRALFAQGWSGIAAPAVAMLDTDSFGRLANDGLIAALPGLEGFDDYLDAAPAAQLEALLDAAGGAHGERLIDDRLVARLVRMLARKGAGSANAAIGSLIEALVARGRERGVGLALSIGLLRHIPPSMPPASAAAIQAMRGIFGEIGGGSLPRDDRVRLTAAALYLVNRERSTA